MVPGTLSAPGPCADRSRPGNTPCPPARIVLQPGSPRVAHLVFSRCRSGRQAMKNFLRALRFCWPYRYRLGLSILCALLAAVFWGLNFTAIYPVLKILGSDKNLQEWVDQCIAESDAHIATLTAKQEQLNKEDKEADKLPEGKKKEGEKSRVAQDLAKVTGQLA